MIFIFRILTVSSPSFATRLEYTIAHSLMMQLVKIVVDLVMKRIPLPNRAGVLETLHQYRNNPGQRRAQLLKKGILRSMIDEFDVLMETGL